ncbi:MAG: hypothetical protein M0042_09490 [Nitrospiraceae bacterium]|nr:hypothetical protein [Nitrospiraceae bacterium]
MKRLFLVIVGLLIAAVNLAVLHISRISFSPVNGKDGNLPDGHPRGGDADSK